MRTLIFLILIIAALANPCFAAMRSSMRNVFGGYNSTDSDGNSYTSMPNAFGGYNTSGNNGYQATSMPNVFGGYNSFDNSDNS